MAGSDSSTDSSGHNILYHYQPSLVAAIIFTTLFSVTTMIHLFQAIRKRAWFLTPFIIGGIFEAIAYIGRIISSSDRYSLVPYVMQTLLSLLAPALYAATIYMILGRIILLTDGDRYAILRRTWLTKIFVGGDILSFLTQSTGGSMIASAKGDQDKSHAGELIIIGGLFIQIIFFGFFVVVAILFQRRGREHLSQIPQHVSWKKHLVVLYATSMLILVRSVFRVVEYLQGSNGYLLRHEVFLYVFDALLMFVVMALMNLVHPGDIALMLQQKGREGTYEMVQNIEAGGKTRRERRRSRQASLGA